MSDFFQMPEYWRYRLSRTLTTGNLVWNINLPQASHFGGVWERAIRGVREVIDTVLIDLKSSLLEEEEFRTLLAEAVRSLNSTPLWTMSDSANEPTPLTLDMLLNPPEEGNAIGESPAEESDARAYGSLGWQRVNFLKEKFWQEWCKYYLVKWPNVRNKWLKKQTNIKVGDVVLDENGLQESLPQSE